MHVIYVSYAHFFRLAPMVSYSHSRQGWPGAPGLWQVRMGKAPTLGWMRCEHLVDVMAVGFSGCKSQMMLEYSCASHVSMELLAWYRFITHNLQLTTLIMSSPSYLYINIYCIFIYVMWLSYTLHYPLLLSIATSFKYTCKHMDRRQMSVRCVMLLYDVICFVFIYTYIIYNSILLPMKYHSYVYHYDWVHTQSFHAQTYERNVYATAMAV